MLTEIHAALQQLIWEYGRISPDEVDISFEAPTRERIERLVKPTVSMFLFDLVENTDMRQSNFPATRVGDHAERRMPPRRVDLRYMVSALTSEIEDEHRLLWRVLATLLKYPQLPESLLPDELRGGEVSLTTKTNQMDEGRRLFDVWGGLGATPHPAIYYVVTAPLDLEIVGRSPLVLTRTLRYRRVADDASVDATTDIGGIVRGKSGAPMVGASLAVEGSAREPVLTSAAGEFVISGISEGALRLRVTPAGGGRARTFTLNVPAASYDITLD